MLVDDSLSENENAIHILEQPHNIDKIDWGNLSQNKKALPILSQPEHIDKINWRYLSKNPSLFELDYIAMSKQKMKIIETELLEKALHPSRISNWLDQHLINGKDICDFEY